MHGFTVTQDPYKLAIRRWLRFGAVLAVVFGAIFAADVGGATLLFDWVKEHPGSDKIGHFILLGSLSFSLNIALRGRRQPIGRWRPNLGGLAVGVIITLEEISQIWISTRQFEWADLVANYAGIACADWLARRRLR